MRITRVEVIPVRVPLKAGWTTKTAHGEHIDSPYVVLRLHTDAALIGLGEATLAPRWSGETSPGCVGALEQLIAPVLLNADPLERTALMARVQRVIRHNPFTKAAVEMALWDLAGKSANVPVYRLLGGKVRDAVPIKMVVGAFETSRAVALAEKFLAWGVKCLKVKTGLDPTGDLARVQAVREAAGPNVAIGIDCNCGWNLDTARRLLDRMLPLNILFAEQPIPAGDPVRLAELRQASRIPIMADESLFTLADAWALATARSTDLFSVYPGKHGGIAETVEIVHVAQAAGLACCMGSNLELGVGTAAMLHVAAAMANIDSEAYPADIIGPLYHEADLLTEPLQLGPEVALVPQGPGLGVELDMSQVERWRQ